MKPTTDFLIVATLNVMPIEWCRIFVFWIFPAFLKVGSAILIARNDSNR